MGIRNKVTGGFGLFFRPGYQFFLPLYGEYLQHLMTQAFLVQLQLLLLVVFDLRLHLMADVTLA